MKSTKSTSSLITRNGHKMNALTLEEGGYILKMEYSDGSTQYTKNTKSPYHYIATTLSNLLLEGRNIIRATVASTGELVYESGSFTRKFNRGGK